MLKGEYMVQKLEAIKNELRIAPDIDIKNRSVMELCMTAGQLSSYVDTTYRMIQNLIDEVNAAIEKDAEFERRWQKDFEEARKGINGKEETDGEV